MSFDITEIIGELAQGAVDEAKKIAVNALKEAAADAVDFVQKALPNMSAYINQLAEKQITVDEFKDLMLGLKDLAEMAGLTQAGLAAIEIEKTRNAILKGVTSVALGAVNRL